MWQFGTQIGAIKPEALDPHRVEDLVNRFTAGKQEVLYGGGSRLDFRRLSQMSRTQSVERPSLRSPVMTLGARRRHRRGRITEAFYANLFLMMAESDRREITAREIDERREESISIFLGPVLGYARLLLQFHLGLITRRALP